MNETKTLIERLKSIGEIECAERMQNLWKANIDLLNHLKDCEKQLILIKKDCDESNEQ